MKEIWILVLLFHNYQGTIEPIEIVGEDVCRKAAEQLTTGRKHNYKDETGQTYKQQNNNPVDGAYCIFSGRYTMKTLKDRMIGH